MDKMEIGQEEKSRKKLLVPLIVLLLCAVSLTGAAYAYNSTVTNVENNVHVEGVTLDLKNGENAVSEAIFDINVAYGPHNTQGKAVKYVIGDNAATYGFTSKTINDQFDPTKPESDQNKKWNSAVQDVKKVDDPYTVTEFDPGYYVETTIDTGNGTYVGPAKYQSDTTYDSKAALDDAITATGKGVYKVGNDYTLTLENKSDKAVTLKMKAQYDEIPGFTDGVKAIYLVVKENGTETKTTADALVEKVIALIPSEANSKDISADIAGFAKESEGTTFTVSAYVVCSDYYSSTMPTDLDKDYGFVLQFTAATA